MSDKKPNIDSRLDLMKNGFKNFVSKVRLPMSAETKWTLEIVCLTPDITPINQSSNYSAQAKNYLQTQLLQMQTQINQQKQEWLAVMKD